MSDSDDENDFDASPLTNRAIPSQEDANGRRIITVVHNNGFHSLPVNDCHCNRSNDHQGPNSLEISDFLELDLFPASHNRIKTVFTFTVLQDHQLEFLESNTMTYQFHNKLRC